MDKEGPNGDLGLVRVRDGASMEEYVPSHRFEQKAGLSPTERRSLNAHSKSVVEIPYRLASSASPTFDQLKIIITKIKCAPFRKIALRSRGRVDPSSNHSEEDSSRQARGIHDDGQSPSSEASLVRRAEDECNHSHQSNPRNDGDNQALDNSISREDGIEEGVDRSMEVERYRG